MIANPHALPMFHGCSGWGCQASRLDSTIGAVSIPQSTDHRQFPEDSGCTWFVIVLPSAKYLRPPPTPFRFSSFPPHLLPLPAQGSIVKDFRHGVPLPYLLTLLSHWLKQARPIVDTTVTPEPTPRPLGRMGAHGESSLISLVHNPLGEKRSSTRRHECRRLGLPARG